MFQVSHISWCTHKFRSFHNSIVLVSIKVSTHSILNVFQNEAKCKAKFCNTFQVFEYLIQFIVQQRHVEVRHGKFEDSLSSILHYFSICQKVFARFVANFDRQHPPLCPPQQYCSLRIPFVVHVACFCVDLKHKSREILRDIVYNCIFLKVFAHYAFWQYDNSDRFVIFRKNWDIHYNAMYQQNTSSCDAQD